VVRELGQYHGESMFDSSCFHFNNSNILTSILKQIMQNPKQKKGKKKQTLDAYKARKRTQ
jgi:hypothetical protein